MSPSDYVCQLVPGTYSNRNRKCISLVANVGRGSSVVGAPLRDLGKLNVEL